MAEVRSELKQGVLVLHFEEVKILNGAHIQEVSDEISKLLEKPESSKFLLSFEGIRAMGSAMIGELMRIQKHAKERYVELLFCEISPEIMEVVHLLQLNKIWVIYETEAEGIAAHQSVE